MRSPAEGTLGDQMEAQQVPAGCHRGGLLALQCSDTNKGSDIYLNVLDAQRSLYSAQQGLISVRLAKLANQVQLYAVLGGGADSEESHP